MDENMMSTGVDALKSASRSAMAAAGKPGRWLPFVVAAAGIGVLFLTAGPLWRLRPARKVLRKGAKLTLAKIAGQ